MLFFSKQCFLYADIQFLYSSKNGDSPALLGLVGGRHPQVRLVPRVDTIAKSKHGGEMGEEEKRAVHVLWREVDL